jgi:hypothetical protein
VTKLIVRFVTEVAECLKIRIKNKVVISGKLRSSVTLRSR